MSALSAAASDEDGETISDLRAKLGRAHALCRIRFDRIRELEAMLYAVGAGGVGKVEQPPAVKESLTVAYEFYNPDTGHAIVDYSEHTHVGRLSADKGYVAKPLVYQQPPVVEQEPLTDEQIAYCIFEARLGAEGALKRNGSSSYLIARAIERAHGIGGEV